MSRNRSRLRVARHHFNSDHQPRRASSNLTAAALVTAALSVVTLLPAAASASTSPTSQQATSKDNGQAGSNGLIIEINGPISDPFFGSMKYGSDDAAKELGANYQWSAPPNEDNIPVDYANLVSEATGRHPAALVVADFAPAAEDPLIKKAVKSGIPVFMVQAGNTNYKADGALTYVGENPPETGNVAGQGALQSHVHDLLCIDQVPATAALQQRCDGAAQTMKAGGGQEAQLNIPPTDQTNDAAITQDIEGYLNSHKSIDGIFSQGADIATDAYAAMKALGDTSKVKLQTLGVSNADLQQVKDGTITQVIDLKNYLVGYYALEIAVQYVRYGIYPTGPLYPGADVIDKSNVNSVIALQKKYPGLRGAE